MLPLPLLLLVVQPQQTANFNFILSYLRYLTTLPCSSRLCAALLRSVCSYANMRNCILRRIRRTMEAKKQKYIESGCCSQFSSRLDNSHAPLRHSLRPSAAHRRKVFALFENTHTRTHTQRANFTANCRTFSSCLCIGIFPLSYSFPFSFHTLHSHSALTFGPTHSFVLAHCNGFFFCWSKEKKFVHIFHNLK